VQAYAAELNKACRPHLKPTGKSYRIDETYRKVKGRDRHLHRAFDSSGQTITFLLTAKRDTTAAKGFLGRTIDATGNAMRRVMNVDKNPGVSGCGGSAESRRHPSWPGCITPVRVSQLRNRTVPPDSKETSLAGQAKRMADVTRNRNTAPDPEGPSEMAGKKDTVGQAIVIARLFGLDA
jgi:hypothetical protein